MQNIAVLGSDGAVGAELTSRLESEGCSVAKGARETTNTSDTIEVDAADEASVTSFFKAANTQLGSINGLAVCVGSILLKPLHLTKPEQFIKTIEQNLTSAYLASREAVKYMIKDGGSIVLVSSAAAHIGLQNHEAISAAKAGIEGLARSAAATYARSGIRFNCVAPGLVESKMSAAIINNESALKQSRMMHPIGRIGNAKDIASAIFWLLSPEQSWVTGQVINVDGGLASLKTLQRA